MEIVMKDALEDPKSNIKLIAICGLPQRIKSCPVIICKEGDGKFLVDACSAMKTLNSSHIYLCIAIFQRAMVCYPGHESGHM